ncbi:thiol reductant ABC exporter subunit CydD [Roseomonas sp. E05]|uniref:thiol reductant ABC exporter subunit CydD n=1 Tax=Roseomonas sp. E05 TaxID=3046310 RepID=UPI0024BBDD3E|nr:thiol reductant ABC exporter subunit CydD [Roseomonas sp. E05]MDJ0388454.1 thiol reductant ABC exporter subunit CydD [Roseomonas sp. E05]
MSRSPRPPDHPALAAAGSALRQAGLLQSAAALLWVPQAALLALAVARLAAGGGLAAVLPLAALLALAGLARAALDALGGRMAFRAARAALAGLRQDALAALAARSPLDAARPASGLAAAAVAEQAEAVLPYLLRYRPARLRAVLVPLVLLLAVATQSWMAAVILLFCAPLIPLFMALVGLRAKEASEAQMLEVGGMNALLLDRLRGLPTIRAFEAVDITARRLRAAAETLRARTMAVLRIAFLSSAVLELFSALGVAMVAVYIGFHLLGMLPFGTWSGWLGLGPALFVLLLAPAFFDPLRDLAAAWHDRAAGEAALAALARLAAPPALALPGASASAAATPAGRPPALGVAALVFRHDPAARPVFDGFSLQIAGGERVALFGPSGCGKSTLLALLAGLALPESGTVTLGGAALTAGSAATLRRRIAWIGQQPHVFAATLRDNVRLGRAGLDAAVPLARLLPGHDPARRVGEGGLGLSGGETLRLALARAIADPAVGVILADEPTAHLDRATAAEATNALLAAAEGRTLVVATHDPVLAARMNRIVRLPA